MAHSGHQRQVADEFRAARFLTRWAAAGLAIIMVGAIILSRVEMHSPLFTGPQEPGLDDDFLLLAGSVALLAFGGGRWTLDQALMRSRAQQLRRSGREWGRR